jgi:hypothetical protein
MIQQRGPPLANIILPLLETPVCGQGINEEVSIDDIWLLLHISVEAMASASGVVDAYVRIVISSSSELREADANVPARAIAIRHVLTAYQLQMNTP